MASIIKRTYKVRTVDGRTIVKECEHYTIQYRDSAGKIKRVKGYRDKAATKQKAAKLEKQVARGAEGLIDPFAVHKLSPIAGHVKEYLSDLKAGGAAPMYVYIAENRLNRLVKECGWTCLADVNADSFRTWRDRERDDHEIKRKARLGKGASATTLNQYLDAARAFTNWCATNGRIEGVTVARRRNRRGEQLGMMALALASVAKVDGAKRRERRALSDEQVAALLLAAPAERAIVYRIGLATGLRRSELEQLRWSDLRLNAIKPFVQLRAEATKARRADAVPIPATLADDLRKLRPADASHVAPVFPAVPCIDTWKADLEAANIPYKDEAGRQADFHGGTRKTLCTRLHRSGTPLATAMKIMRHSDSRLTLVDYTDDEQLGVADSALPEIAAAAKNHHLHAQGA